MVTLRAALAGLSGRAGPIYAKNVIAPLQRDPVRLLVHFGHEFLEKAQVRRKPLGFRSTTLHRFFSLRHYRQPRKFLSRDAKGPFGIPYVLTRQFDWPVLSTSLGNNS